jgi:hypothetical protein
MLHFEQLPFPELRYCQQPKLRQHMKKLRTGYQQHQQWMLP